MGKKLKNNDVFNEVESYDNYQDEQEFINEEDYSQRNDKLDDPDLLNDDLSDEYDDEMFEKEINETLEKITDSNKSDIFNITVEEIDASLGALDSPTKKRGRTKKKITLETDEIVRNFLNDRSDENFRAIMDRFWYGVKKFAYTFVKDYDMADDMTITTFERAHQHIDTFNIDKAQFSTWLWTICRNNCIHYLKQKAKENIVDSDISDIYDSALMGTCMAKTEVAPQYVITETGDIQGLSLVDLTHKLYDASVNEINNMEGTAGTILQMKLIDNMKIREIGVELNMNESTVKNYLYKGKSELNDIMKNKHKELYEMYLEANAENDENEMLLFMCA